MLPSVDLTEFDPTLSTSRRHAEIHHTHRGYTIEDLGSLNTTILRGAALTPGQSTLLVDGDEVRFGAVVATFRLMGAGPLPPPFSVP